MALEGQLSDFNLAEILQLLSSQQKSGFLNLEANRDMVFIFDKGVLISTRDRRSRSRDPLEVFLKAYGYFNEDQWRHLEYVQKNSSLDLTEILVSEGFFSEEQMNKVLMGVAQEMTHAGMKIRRGRYQFTPTKDTPPGVKWKIHFGVQGLLMEAARRLDEERLLKEYLPSQALTFCQGNKSMPPGELGPIGQHVMELALAGLPLGRIIRQGQAESFVVRDLLKNWCEEGILKKIESRAADDNGDGRGKKGRRSWLKSGLRSLPLTLLAVVLLSGLGHARWTRVPEPDPEFGHGLRLSQLRAEVIDAARLFRYQKGEWPDSLAELVRNGQLPTTTLTTLRNLGWEYSLDRQKDQFSLG